MELIRNIVYIRNVIKNWVQKYMYENWGSDLWSAMYEAYCYMDEKYGLGAGEVGTGFRFLKWGHKRRMDVIIRVKQTEHF